MCIRDRYRLAFCMNGGGNGVATIIPAEGSCVDGVLWRISEMCIRDSPTPYRTRWSTAGSSSCAGRAGNRSCGTRWKMCIRDSYNSYDVPANLPWLRYVMLFNPINFFANGYRNCCLYIRWFFEYKTELAIFLLEFAALFVLGLSLIHIYIPLLLQMFPNTVIWRQICLQALESSGATRWF